MGWFGGWKREKGEEEEGKKNVRVEVEECTSSLSSKQTFSFSLSLSPPTLFSPLTLYVACVSSSKFSLFQPVTGTPKKLIIGGTSQWSQMLRITCPFPSESMLAATSAGVRCPNRVTNLSRGILLETTYGIALLIGLTVRGSSSFMSPFIA